MRYTSSKLSLPFSLALLSACSAGPFTITSNGTHVTVTPASAVKVQANATQSFTVTPDAEHTLVSSVGGTCPAGSWSGNVYTTGKIIANCSVSFSAALETFSVGVSGNHVTISPEAPQTVSAGSTQSFTVTPDPGYSTSMMVDGTCPAGSWNGSTYTTGPITANCTIMFNAILNTYQVTVSGDSGESFTPTTPQTVGYGTTQSYTVMANPGYTLSPTVGGTCPAGSWSEKTYTTGPITADCTVHFSATLNTYHVTASGDSWETISPSDPQTVSYGATQSYAITANAGYTLSPTVGGTCPAGSWNGSTYSTGAIAADCTVTFSATLNTYQVTASGDFWETITPSDPQTASYGATESFTVVANAGYTLSPMVGGTCPAGSWSASTYTTGAITANCTVVFSATLNTYRVTATGDSWETISPGDPQTVPYGATQSYTLTANASYALLSLVGGTCPAGSWNGSTYTTGPITANCTVTFSATPTYQVFGVGVSSTVSPSDTQTVNSGATQSFTVTANPGFTLSTTVGGTCPLGSWSGSTYTTGPITANCYAAFTATENHYQVTASGDGRETFSPSTPQTVLHGSTRLYMVTANPGFLLSSTVGGTCPTGSWGGGIYETGPITADCTVVFSANPAHQVSATGDSNEAISPATPQEILDGATVSYTVTASGGYVLSTTVGGTCPAGSWSDDVYTTGAITTDCTVSFSALPASQVTVSGDSNLTVNPNGGILVANGNTQAITVTPGNGEAASFAVGGTCPAGTWSGSVYTTGTITGDCTVSFIGITPVLQPLQWNATASDLATVAVSNVPGAVDTLRFSYQDATGGGSSVTRTYTAQASAASDEAITLAWSYSGFHAYYEAYASLQAFADGPAGRTSVTLQAWSPVSGNFTFSGTTSLYVHAGYAFGVIASGANFDSNRNLDGTVTLSTISEASGNDVTASGDSQETISPVWQVVPSGNKGSFTVTANTGYTLSQTVGGTCPAGSWRGDVYSTGAVTSDCTVSFAAGYPVTATGVDVNIGPSTTLVVPPGGTQTFTVTASSGFTLSSTVGGTCPAGSWDGSVYTTGAISGACSVRFSVQAVFLFATGPLGVGSLGNRTTTTNVCQAASSGFASLPCSKVAPLLGYSPNGVTDVPTVFSLPTDEPVLGPSGGEVASNWSALLSLTTTLDGTLYSTGVLPDTSTSTTVAWTGFGTGGSATQDCGDWTSATSAASGEKSGPNGWSSYRFPCNDSAELICLCWSN